MAQPQAYSIAELTRCKLLHEVSVKDRDLRRLVGHVNMYDRLLDVINAEEIREREKSPPKTMKTESDARRVKFSECPCPDRATQQALEQIGDIVAAKKEIEALGFASHCQNVSLGSQDGYCAVEVVEVEILDDDD
jgi:hypothetical protein